MTTVWEVCESERFMDVSVAQEMVMQEGDLFSHRALGVAGSCGIYGLQTPFWRIGIGSGLN